MLKIILVYAIIFIIPFGLILGIAGFIIGYPWEKLKGVLTGLAIAAGISLPLGVMFGGLDYYDTIKYNNGICEHCQVEREFKNSTSTRFTTHYTYQCPECNEIVTVDEIVVEYNK